MLMALGPFVFSIEGAPLDQLRRRRDWRHPSGDRVGLRPASQFAGPGDDAITIVGAVADGQLGRLSALEDLAAMADSGAAWPLVDAEGYVYGAFVILALDETGRYLGTGGRPRLMDFAVDLRRADDDEGDPAAPGRPVRA